MSASPWAAATAAAGPAAGPWRCSSAALLPCRPAGEHASHAAPLPLPCSFLILATTSLQTKPFPF
jgi:hypothetical protein